MTQLTQPEPPSGRRMRPRSQAWSMPSPQTAQSNGPSQPVGFEWQAQATQQSGSSGQPDPFQQSLQPDPIDILAARFSEGRSAGPSGGVFAGSYAAPAGG